MKKLIILFGFIFAISFISTVSGDVKEDEDYTLRALGSLRTAISIYFGDKEGLYPVDPQKELPIIYITQIPISGLTHHKLTNKIRVITEGNNRPLDYFVEDTGQWLYMADEKSRDWGTIIIDCTHVSSRGERWNSY